MALRMTFILALVAAASLVACGVGKLEPVQSADTSGAGPVGLAFAVGPQNAYARQSLASIQVAIKDANRTTVESATDSVTLSLLSGPGPLSGTLTQQAVNGVATFDDLNLGVAADGYVLLAASGELFSAASGAFTVMNNLGQEEPSAVGLAFVNQPQTIYAQQTLPPVVVAVKDANGVAVGSTIETVTLSILSGPGPLSGTLTRQTVDGVATFDDLKLGVVGEGYVLSATSQGLFSAATNAFRVMAVPGTSVSSAVGLRFTTQPQNANALQTLPPIQVAVEDANGVGVGSATNTVTLSVLSGPSILSGTLSRQAVNGVATFDDLKPGVAGGGYVLLATSGELFPAASASFTVTAVPAQATPNSVGLAFVTQPQNSYVQQTLPPIKVAVEDANSVLVGTAANKVTLAVMSGAGPLSGTTTQQAVNGIATFNDLSLGVAGGAYVLSATSASLFPASSTSFAVTAISGPSPPSPAGLAFVAQPQNTNVLQTLPPVKVAVQDANGMLVSTAANTVTLSVLSGPGSLSGTLTQQAVNGIATFNDLNLGTVGGGYVLSATSQHLFPAASTPFAATATTSQPAPSPAGLTFVAQPQNVYVGQTLAPVAVAVKDANGFLVGGATNTITLSVLDGPGPLSGQVTRQAVNGVASFSSLYMNMAGAGYVLSATSYPLFSAASTPFTVSALPTATPVGLAFVSQPQNGNIAQTLPPIQVAIQTANHTLSSSSTLTVALSLLNAAGPINGTLTRQAVGGIATFDDVNLGTAGTGYIFSATAYPLFPAASTPFTINNVPPPGKLAFATQPNDTNAGQNMSPAVAVNLFDVNGLLDTGSTATVTLAIKGGNVTFCNGSLTAQASGGVATFTDVCLQTAGTGYTLVAGAPRYTGVTSTAFKVLPLAPSKLLFGPFPAVVQAGFTTSPAVKVMAADVYSNGPLNYTGSIALDGTVASGVPLDGTLVQPLVNGVATFADLTVDQAGAGYQITASNADLGGVSSPTFSVVGGPATALNFVQQPNGTTQAGSPFSPVVVVSGTDAYGNPASGNVTLQSDVGGATLYGALTQPLQAGKATFATIDVQRAGSNYALTAVSATTSATSTTFSIVPGPFGSVVVTQQPPPTVAVGIAFNLVVASSDVYGNLVPVSGAQIVSGIYGPWGDGGAGIGTLTNGYATIPEKLDSFMVGAGSYFDFQCGCSASFRVKSNTFTATASF